VLQQKCQIYASGCKKRGRREEAAGYESLAHSALPSEGAVRPDGR
jgi:hypothetical protein